MRAAEECRLGGFRGWRCVIGEHVEGPCGLVPKWWNVRDKWRYRRNLAR
jgi:hypothetical protein